ncbi:MAG: M48 family metallopeptidase [Planctomycetota bacterium]
MQIVVIAAFVTALSLLEAPLQLADARWAGPAVPAYLLIALVLSGANTALSLRSIARQGGPSSRILRRYNRLLIVSRFWLIAGLAATLLMGFASAVRQAGLMSVPLAAELVALAPFAAALMLTWATEYPFHLAVRRHIARREALQGQPPRPVWTLGQYLTFNLRHHLLFVAVPVGFILLLSDVLNLYVAPYFGDAAMAVRFGGTLAAAGLVFVIAPLMLVRVWHTAPLADGQLRDKLERLLRRLKLRARDIRVWHTGGVLANAGVMGVVAPVRYVLLSDALLEEMDDDQIQAVFAHEAGHIVHHHIFYAVLFAAGSVLLCTAGTDLVLGAVGADPGGAGQLWSLAVVALVWAVGFGWISRRFERQSDVLAAWVVGQVVGDTDVDDDRIAPEGAAIFARALEKIAVLNGIPLSQRNWRHGSIARRAEYVLWLGSTGRGRHEADRTVRRIKLILWLLLLLSVAVAGMDFSHVAGAG